MVRYCQNSIELEGTHTVYMAEMDAYFIKLKNLTHFGITHTHKHIHTYTNTHNNILYYVHIAGGSELKCPY